jgi:hypothetical protein
VGPPGATGARQPGPDRRLQDRRRSPTATSQAAHRRQDPPPSPGPPQAGVEERHGVMIVTPFGTLPDPLPAGLVEQLEVSLEARPVIVDLSQVTLVTAAPVMGLVAWVLGASQQPDQCCVVCPRATARALLGKWHVTRCVAIFGSVGEALQARRFDDEGYGAGWHPDPPGQPRPNPSVGSRRPIVEPLENAGGPQSRRDGRRAAPAVFARPGSRGTTGSAPHLWA